MRRELPDRPSLEHLKKQAKDLLDDYRRGDAAALQRIAAALPGFGGSPAAPTDGDARPAIALHDAQSAIAREHGFRSWNELRAEVAKRADSGFPGSIVSALMGRSLPDAVTAALRGAWLQQSEVARAAATECPELLPLLPVRSTLLLPHSIAPIHVGRPSTLAAVEAARQSTPPLVAVFAQRAAEAEVVDGGGALHPVGCMAVVLAQVPDAEHLAFVVLQATRWISLTSLQPAGTGSPYAIARVAPVRVDVQSGASEMPALVESLRARARALAGALPDSAKAIALIDEIDDHERLVDLVMANLVCSVDEKARYAATPKLVDKLRIAIALCTELRGPA